MPPAKLIDAEVLAQARRLYEETLVPVDEIARLLGMRPRTFHERRKDWGWRLRMGRPTVTPSAVPDLPVEPDAAADRAGLIARIRETVDREISEIDQSLQKLDRLTGTSGMERSARTLATLVKTLTELKKLDEADREPAAQEANERRERPDMDEFRRSIARRFEALCRAEEI